MSYVIMGDLNARLGDNIHNIVGDNASFTYQIIDSGVNDSGKRIATICKDHNLLVVNNLCTEAATFPGALTFRKKK